MNSELNHDGGHSDPDVLALLAMGETVPDADARHVESCAACEREVTELGRVVNLARAGTSGGFAEAPSSDVWSRISADLGLAGDVVPPSIRRANAAAAAVASAAPSTEAAPASEAASAEEADSAEEHAAAPAGHTLHAVPRASDSPPLTGSVRTGSMSAGTGERARRRRGASKRGRWISLVAAAAAVVIVGGIAITASLQRGPSVEVLAAVELGALPDWEGAAGDAVVELSDDGERNVVVTMASDGAVDGYREVWLISEDLSALVSVGVLEGENGRFVIPAGIDLEDYPIVDVSDEPLDGNPDHSGNSIVRGTLES